MGEPGRQRHTWAEYLALDDASELKHEYREGWIVAMTGGTPRHARLIARLISLTDQRLDRSGPCRVYSGDLRIRVMATGRATYPDLSVVCGEEEHEPSSPHTVTNPTAIAEVLSDSTESYDRGDKFFHYQQLPSLRDYVLVSQHRRQVDHFQRTDDGAWRVARLGPGDTLPVHPGIEIAIDDLYEGILAEPDDAPAVAGEG